LFPHDEILQTMESIASAAPHLELALLRKSVGALAARRHSCVHCRRTPLVGERIYLYGERLVCELCRPLRREAPQSSELVYSPEHKRAVRVRRA
jgi:hypothetical protein